MKGASRTILSQPLAALAPKTASGGKIRARRFAPGRAPHKPLYRFGKTRPCAQTRVGAPILANTIGSLAADAVAGKGEALSVKRSPLVVEGYDDAIALPDMRALSDQLATAVGPISLIGDNASESASSTVGALSDSRGTFVAPLTVSADASTPNVMVDYVGGKPYQSPDGSVVTIQGRHMGWLEKVGYDLTHPAQTLSRVAHSIGTLFTGSTVPTNYGGGFGPGRGQAELANARLFVSLIRAAPPVSLTVGGDAYLGYGASGSAGFSFDLKTGQLRGLVSGGAGPGYGGGVGINVGTGGRDAGAQTNFNLTGAYGLSGTVQVPLDQKTGAFGHTLSGGSIGRGLPGIKGAAAGFGPRVGGWANASIDYTSSPTPALWDLDKVERLIR